MLAKPSFLVASLLAGVLLLSAPAAHATAARHHHRDVVARALCGPPPPGMAQCQGEVLTDASGTEVASTTPGGLGPADLLSAYKLPSSGGAGQTVAIVDAYDDPNAESDLAVYRSTFALPACTTGNGCFAKVDQTGGINYPPPDNGWAAEISLDIDMVSAVCPSCHILLVEANTPSLPNLAAAVDTAATLHATEISNSYARAEWSRETMFDSHYHHPGIMITVASGNGGYAMGATYPAASPYVTAVGGTTLAHAANARGWSEAAWVKTSSGCSVYEPKPAWQKDKGCAKRTVADTAAVAANIAMYDSYNKAGWLHGYGTSFPTPMVAALYALEGNAATLNYGSSTYRSGASLFDITTGSTGSCGSYLCNAAVGYDGPTGNGTPDGAGAY